MKLMPMLMMMLMNVVDDFNDTDKQTTKNIPEFIRSPGFIRSKIILTRKMEFIKKDAKGVQEGEE